MAAKRKAVKRVKAKVVKKTSRRTSSSKNGSSANFMNLKKSKSDRMVSGVIGGLAEYFNVDSTILRLLWIAVVAFTGFVPGVLAYIVAMAVMPEA